MYDGVYDGMYWVMYGHLHDGGLLLFLLQPKTGSVVNGCIFRDSDTSDT